MQAIVEKLRAIVLKNETTAGKVFDLSIQGLIASSLVTFSIETLPNLSAGTQKVLRIVEIATVMIFTVEYVLRIALTKKRLGFVFSFYGLIDLLAIFPFYIGTGVDLRSVRVFRLFRLVRALKLFRYNKALNRFRVAFSMIREELILFLAAMLFLLFVAGVGIYYFENAAQPDRFASIFHSLWWAVATLTTVGYGDIYPITSGGRIFAFVMLLIGMGIVAVPTGLIASAMTKAIALEKNQTTM